MTLPVGNTNETLALSWKLVASASSFPWRRRKNVRRSEAPDTTHLRYIPTQQNSLLDQTKPANSSIFALHADAMGSPTSFAHTRHSQCCTHEENETQTVLNFRTISFDANFASVAVSPITDSYWYSVPTKREGKNQTYTYSKNANDALSPPAVTQKECAVVCSQPSRVLFRSVDNPSVLSASITDATRASLSAVDRHGVGAGAGGARGRIELAPLARTPIYWFSKTSNGRQPIFFTLEVLPGCVQIRRDLRSFCPVAVSRQRREQKQTTEVHIPDEKTPLSLTAFVNRPMGGTGPALFLQLPALFHERSAPNGRPVLFTDSVLSARDRGH
ncbi:hypothetical protein EVAR_82857_1 [Eumeta japonica]|uniref:Uncharacterized protein n=1 Tax=Eumeta variegata TaxID=151549 RepID=A0A4C1V2H4_EUMVA|nr:hypothetical protein EVAR_82857_1 [Eumeta japonica]